MIFFLVYLIISIVVMVSEQKCIKETDKTVFELDDFLNGTFLAHGWNGSWISDNAFLYKDQYSNILKYNIEAKSSEVLLSKDVMEKYPGATITLSEDQSYVLLKYNVSEVFRHSTTAVFTIYDIKTRKYYDLANKMPLQLVTFAPLGHGLVYVLENNIYYLKDFAVDTQTPIIVTTAGITGSVYCGVADWVYEEEVLSSNSALWISPDATHVAYAVFHDEDVRIMTYTVFGKPGSLEENQYPYEALIRYPKVGTPNPLVSIYLYSIPTKTTIEFQLPNIIRNKEPNDYIFYGLSWISDEEVAMVSSNRLQNASIVIRCFISGICEEEYDRKEAYGWITPTLPHYNTDGSKRLEILPQPVHNDRYDHLVLTDVSTKSASRLTNGKSTVISIEGWNHKDGVIYYTATAIDDPSVQNVYSIRESGGSPTCMTCSLLADDDSCKHGATYFSKSFSYYTKACLGPNPPIVTIENTKNVDDTLLWEDNSKLRAALTSKAMPVIKNLVVPINEEFSARVRLFLPPNLDPNKKYPAIVYTYGGPGQNQISNTFSIGFQHYLVTNREYIYIYIDGRGTGNDGYNKLYQMYKKFGTVEVEDQMQVTKYLQKNLPYIDAERTGIWGWSYGGFCSSSALAKDSNHIFKAALAVAPVTNFMLYDTIYTERYMGLPTPEDNQNGYNNTDLTLVVEAFRGRNYFIIHGTGDDNVHYQNSMLLSKALELADIQFRQQSYTDENHSLGHVSRHLYHTMDNYWATQFDTKSLWSQKETKSS